VHGHDRSCDERTITEKKITYKYIYNIHPPKLLSGDYLRDKLLSDGCGQSFRFPSPRSLAGPLNTRYYADLFRKFVRPNFSYKKLSNSTDGLSARFCSLAPTLRPCILYCFRRDCFFHFFFFFYSSRVLFTAPPPTFKCKCVLDLTRHGI